MLTCIGTPGFITLLPPAGVADRPRSIARTSPHYAEAMAISLDESLTDAVAWARLQTLGSNPETHLELMRWFTAGNFTFETGKGVVAVNGAEVSTDGKMFDLFRRMQARSHSPADAVLAMCRLGANLDGETPALVKIGAELAIRKVLLLPVGVRPQAIVRGSGAESGEPWIVQYEQYSVREGILMLGEGVAIAAVDKESMECMAEPLIASQGYTFLCEEEMEKRGRVVWAQGDGCHSFAAAKKALAAMTPPAGLKKRIVNTLTSKEVKV